MNIKKAITLFLALAMAVSLVACAGGKPAATDLQPPSESSGTTSPETLQSQEPVELTIMKAGDSSAVIEGNQAIEMIEKACNVKLNIILPDDLTEAISLALASGNLPDILVSSKFDYQNYYDSGYFLELTDLLNKYGSEVMIHISQEAWDLTTVNGGKIYGIPGEGKNSKYVTALRKDWLNSLNIEVKENYTVDEFASILHAFTYNDPDQNGQNDTYGLSALEDGANWEKTLMAVFGAFGGQPNQTYLVGEEFVPFNVSDDFRAALQYLNELWSDGVMDPEMFILNSEQAVQKIVQGKSGAFCSWWSGPKSVFEAGIEDITPEADFAKVFITSNDGTKVGMLDNGLIQYMTMITTACEHPEEAMKLINYMMTDEGYMLITWGVEGFNYKLDENNYVIELNVEKDWWPLAATVRRLDAPDREKVPASDSKADKTIVDFELIQEPKVNAPLYQSAFYGLPITTEEIELGADLKAFVTKSVISFITGEIALTDENWAAYKQEWIQKGGQKILDSYTAEYNKIKSASYKSAVIK